MKRLSSVISVVLCLAASKTVHADIYKCTSPQGKVSFAAVPCEPYQGVTSLQRPGPPSMASAQEPADHAHQVNLKAIEYLRTPIRSTVRLDESASYKLRQRNGSSAPPCAVMYKGQCIDATGAPPEVHEAMRKALKTP